MSDSETFEGKADRAGEALKKQLGLEPTKVKVDSDGREVQPPPRGSYAAMEIERAQRERAVGEVQTHEALTEGGSAYAVSREPVGTSASEEPAPVRDGKSEEETPGVKARIAELTRLRREEERRRAEVEAERTRLQEEVAKRDARYAELETAHQQLLERNLDHLDPEERARVVARAETLQLVEGAKREILATITPTMQQIREAEFTRELSAVADKYPGYDHVVHADLIRMFLERNPASNVEQAFRAVASDEELYLRRASQPPQVSEVPTSVPPRGTMGTSRYVPASDDPDDVLRKETRRVHDLARSTDPLDQREHQRAIHDLLRKRLGG